VAVPVQTAPPLAVHPVALAGDPVAAGGLALGDAALTDAATHPRMAPLVQVLALVATAAPVLAVALWAAVAVL
jgi:hypothetical protein